MAKNNNKLANDAENKTNIQAENAENKNVNNNEKEEMKVVALPTDPLNPKNDKVKVVINGVETEIVRGKQQNVSKAVYERLVIAGYVIEG